MFVSNRPVFLATVLGLFFGVSGSRPANAETCKGALSVPGLSAAQALHAAGRFDAAASAFLRIPREGDVSCAWLEAQVLAAESLMAAGRHGDAYRLLIAVRDEAEAGGPAFRAKAAGALGKATFLFDGAVKPDPETETALAETVASLDKRRLSRIEALYGESVRFAAQANDPMVEAIAWQNLASIQRRSGKLAESAASLKQAGSKAAVAGAGPVLAGISVTKAEWAADGSVDSKRTVALSDAAGRIEALSDSALKTDLYLRLARVALMQPERSGAGDLDAARDHYQRALKSAQAIGYAAGMSSAFGGLGKIAELRADFREAETLSNKALTATLGSDTPELTFQWYWQLGRALQSQKRHDEALVAYEKAVGQVKLIRGDISKDQRARNTSYRDVVGSLYLQAADLKLQKAKRQDGNNVQATLEAARGLVEDLKSVELQDYYDDECVTELRKKSRGLDELLGANDPSTAAIYPVMLQDRLEILVTFAKGDIILKTEAVSRETLTALIREFRLGLGAWADDARFMQPSVKLYGHLIRPVLPELRRRGIKTLVFVPDGPFRTVPLGALNDGGGRANGFLLNEFAVSYAPSLQLLESGDVPAKGKSSILAAGVTVSRPGLAPGRPAFARLPSVKKELDFLRTSFGTQPLVDAGFTKSAVSARLSTAPYTIVHLATHGEFLGEAANTFLLAYDGPMSLNRLEQLIKLSRFRNNPVELLFLSACKTAAGDDKAALGLAGIAVKSGARSVVATLWPANDAAAAELVRVFYTELGKSGVSKAEALRRSQLALLNGQQFEHPQMWAPFLLIGDWKPIGA